MIKSSSTQLRLSNILYIQTDFLNSNPSAVLSRLSDLFHYTGTNLFQEFGDMFMKNYVWKLFLQSRTADSCFFSLGSYFETERHSLLSPPIPLSPTLSFPLFPPVGHNYKSSSHHMGPNPIIAGAERGVFASRSSSLIRTKITRISSCGTKPRLKTGWGGTSSRLRCEMVQGWRRRRRRRRCFAWQWADSVYAWSHGAGRPSNRGWMWRRPRPDAPWLIVLPRESPGRPVLSHWGAEARV